MDTRDALLSRVALAAPAARTHGQHFNDVLLGLAELFGTDVAEEVRGRVTAVVDPGAFNYPVVELLNLCDVAAHTAELRTGRPYGEVLEQLGAFTVRKFLESSLGKAMWLMAPRDMHEALRWSLVSLRSVLTHGQRRYERLGPSDARIVFREELMGPAWMRGIFLSGIQALSQQRTLSISIEHLGAPGLEFVLRFTW